MLMLWMNEPDIVRSRPSGARFSEGRVIDVFSGSCSLLCLIMMSRYTQINIKKMMIYLHILCIGSNREREHEPRDIHKSRIAHLVVRFGALFISSGLQEFQFLLLV